MKMRILLSAAFLLLQCCLWPASTNSFDQHRLAYYRKTMLEAYEKVGQHNPAWDPEVRNCLTLYAESRCVTNVSGSELNQRLLASLATLATLKCDDPVIRYLHARFVYAEDHSPQEVATVARDVSALVAKSAYQADRKFNATVWAGQSLRDVDSKSPDVEKLYIEAAGYLAKALDDPSLPERELGAYCEALLNGYWRTNSTKWKLYRIIEPSLTNRWGHLEAAYLAKGRAYLDHGWAARGTGYANTVSDEGWKLLKERLEIAEAALSNAWKLNERDVRVCQEMMRVQQGLSNPESIQAWFERGMKLDPASYDLCYQRIESLRARWFGSREAMIEFGRTCTMNTNYFGSARLFLAEAHYEITREIQDPTARQVYWLMPEVWADIKFCYEQYFKLFPKDVGWRHNYAKYAARCNQWEEFLKQTALFASTNYSYFGGQSQFESMVGNAESQVRNAR